MDGFDNGEDVNVTEAIHMDIPEVAAVVKSEDQDAPKDTRII